MAEVDPMGDSEPVSQDITRADGHVNQARRAAVTGHEGQTVWFTGLSGSGKSTLAFAVEEALIARDVAAYVLDGDNVRMGLNRDLGFLPDDRTENVRRIGEVCRLFQDAGLVVLTAFISPYRADREVVRALHPDGTFTEVFVDTPLEVCEERDPKGLYVKAKTGEIPNFTGISAPYEAPESPEIAIKTADCTPEEAAGQIIALLEKMGKF